MGRYEVSQRRAAAAARFWRSSLRYESRRDPLTTLRQRMRELAQTRVRFGYRRLLRDDAAGRLGGRQSSASIASTPRKGWRCDGSGRGGMRPRSIASNADRRPRAMRSGAWTSSPTNCADGRRFRALTVIDLFTRECLAIDVGHGAQWSGRRRRRSSACALSGTAAAHLLRQRHGVRQRGDGSLGVHERCHPRLQPSGQADGQRRDRIVQRTVPRRVSERPLVRVTRGRAAEDRRVSVGLQ